jgi:hypothetical protein
MEQNNDLIYEKTTKKGDHEKLEIKGDGVLIISMAIGIGIIMLVLAKTNSKLAVVPLMPVIITIALVAGFIIATKIKFLGNKQIDA